MTRKKGAFPNTMIRNHKRYSIYYTSNPHAVIWDKNEVDKILEEMKSFGLEGFKHRAFDDMDLFVIYARRTK